MASTDSLSNKEYGKNVAGPVSFEERRPSKSEEVFESFSSSSSRKAEQYSSRQEKRRSFWDTVLISDSASGQRSSASESARSSFLPQAISTTLSASQQPFNSSGGVIGKRTKRAKINDNGKERPWACPHCPSRFSIKGHLSQHVRYVHLKWRPHRCYYESCNASFGTQFARNQHCWTVHERKKPFQCTVPGCDSSFGQRSHLNRHLKRHLAANETLLAETEKTRINTNIGDGLAETPSKK